MRWDRGFFQPNDPTPKYKHGNLVYAVQCSEDFKNLYICVDKTNRWPSIGVPIQQVKTQQFSNILKVKGHSFEDSKVYNLEREYNWFTKGVKEGICTTLEQILMLYP